MAGRAEESRLHGARVDLIAIIGLAGVFVALFRTVLFGERFLLIGDPLKQLYPLRVVAWEMIRDGTLPLWTPYLLSGYPLFSMAMLGIGYPLTWGYLFLPGHWAEQIYVLAPYLLAPIFTYLFLRELRRGPVASMIGGITFGFGGFLFSPIGLTGVHANSALWLPLVLVGVARARRARFSTSLLIATAAYTLSVLAGSGQIFLYGGALALAYGVFLAFFPDQDTEAAARPRWQPPAVAFGAIVLSTGLTAYQTLETWTAVGVSVRNAYPLERFAEGSLKRTFAAKSLLQPLGNFWDSSPFVPLLALILTVIAVRAAVKRPRVSPQVFFWFVVAAVAWLLILGKHTPLFDLYGALPLVKRFRYPSRHSLEWTLAVGVLAAYGWDAVEGFFARRAAPAKRWMVAGAASGIALILLAAFALTRWTGHNAGAGLEVIHDIGARAAGLDAGYLGWKAAFTLSIAAALLALLVTTRGAIRTVLLTLAVAVYAFAEPYVWLIRPMVLPFSIVPSMFGSFAETTRIIRSEIGPHERTLSVVHPYVVRSEPERVVDAVNWTALAGFEDANGYESLILERYVRAFRGDAVDAEPFVVPEPRLVGENSHVLDLLGVRYVTAYDGIYSAPQSILEHDGLGFSTADVAVGLAKGERYTIDAAATDADTLLLVTAMSFSGNVEHGQPVARLTIGAADGRAIERELRGGVHTAEWAHDRADVQATVKHQRAPIFDSGPGDEQRTFQSHRYLARIPLGERVQVERIEIEMLAPEATLSLWKVSLFDSTSGLSRPLPEPPPSRWETMFEKEGMTLMKNRRALPRAWLVGAVEVLEAPDILRRIRGVGGEPFDPTQTALVELERPVIPPLPGRLADDAHVRIVSREPSRVVLETNTPDPAMLVVSEIHYPGWLATIDGAEAPIHQTNYLLRGVFVPAGRHRVEMHYKPVGLRRGAAVSLATMLLLGIVVVRSRWRGGAARDEARAVDPSS